MTPDMDPFAALVAASVTGTVVLDDSQHVRYANPAACRLLEQPLAVGDPWPELVPLPSVDEAAIEHTPAAGQALEISARPIHWQGASARLVELVDINQLQSSRRRLRWQDRLEQGLARLSTLAVKGASTEQLQHAALTLVCSNLAVDACAIFAYQPGPETVQFVAGIGWQRHPLDGLAVASSQTTPITIALRDNVDVLVPDWQQETRFAHLPAMRDNLVASCATVPIYRIGENDAGPWGVLTACSQRPHQHTVQELDFLHRLAFVLAHTIQYVELLAREKSNNLRLKMASRAARIGSWEWDGVSKQVFWSEEAAAIHGLPARDRWLELANTERYTAPEYRARMAAAGRQLYMEGVAFDEELEIIARDGRRRWVRVIGEPVRDKHGRITRARGAIQDISASRHVQEQIRELALSDPLTGLPNRRRFEQRLHQAIGQCRQSGHKAALMLLDLDHFKNLNDTRGHSVGDELLMQVAARLSAHLGSEGFVARSGGDEFLLILSDLDPDSHRAAAQAQRIGDRLLAALRAPWHLGAAEYFATHSLGITLFGFANDEPEELLKQADLTMYEAKARGRDQSCFYDPEMQETVKARAALEEDMREGLKQGQFVSYYQPQVDACGRLLGAEVLARWLHPQRGLIAPGSFIPVAETTGMIHQLGQQMLTQACTQLADWAATPARAELNLAVNVSAQQFHHPRFVEDVLAVIQATGANPACLVLELTETSVVNNMTDTAAKMAALGKHGITFALDDFGTGYSSLYYLKNLPLAVLKIDRGFVHGIDTSPDDAAIVRSILALAHSLELGVIAEGVETAAEHAFLADYDCPAYQGYLFGRPQPIEQFTAFSLDPANFPAGSGYTRRPAAGA